MKNVENFLYSLENIGEHDTRCEKNFWTVIPLKNQLTLFLDRVNLSSWS